MPEQLLVLSVEDNETDTELALAELRGEGYDIVFRRVQSEAELHTALEEVPWDVVLTADSLPQISAPAALFLTRRLCPDLPFIVLADDPTVEAATEMMRGGAHDYLPKDDLSRLPVAVERGRQEARLAIEDRRARTALQESLQQCRTLFNGISDGILAEDRRGNVILANEAALKITGRHRESIEGHCGTRLSASAIHEDGTPMSPAEHPLAITLRSGEPVRDVVMGVINPRTQQLVWLRVNCEPIMIPGTDEVGSAVAAFRDITEFRSAQDELNRSEARFRAIFDGSAVGIAVTAMDGTITDCNAALLNMLGITRERFLRMRPEDLFHPEDRHPDLTPWQELVAGKRDHYTWQTRYLQADGSTGWWRLTVSLAHCGPEGELAAVSIIEDITEQKLAEEKLHESEARARFLAEVVERSSLAFAMSRPDASITFVNAAFCKLTGYSAEELQTMKWSDCLTPPEWHHPESQHMERLLTQRTPVLYEKEYFHKNGSRVPVELLCQAIFDDEDNFLHFYAFITDLTARKESERALYESEARYRQMVESMDSCMVSYESVNDGEDFIVVGLNPAARAVSRESTFGRSVREIVSEMQNSDLLDGLRRVWRTGISEAHEACEYHTAQGKRWFYSIVYRLPNQRVVAIFHDVTEHKQAEQALHQSEQRFREMADLMPDMLLECDLEGNVTYYNRLLMHTLGYQDNDPTPRTIFEGVVPEDREELARRWREVLAEAAPGHINCHLLHRQGHGVPVEVSSTVIRAADGTITGVRAVLRDITQRLRARRALQETTARLEAVIEASPVGIVMLDAQMLVRLWNAAAESTFGWSAEEVLGRPFLEVCEGIEEPASTVKSVLKEGHSGILKGCVPRKDGTLIDIVISGAPVRDANGAVIGAMGVILDVTEQLKIRHKLTESEQRFRLLYEEAPVPYHSLDEDGRVLEVNPCWLRRLGYSAEEVIGRHFSDFVEPSQRLEFATAHRSLARGDVPQNLDWKLVRKDGTALLASFTSRASQVPDGRFGATHTVFEDVTEARRAEAEALRSGKLEAVGMLAGGIAHDFNNALLVVIGNLQMARLFPTSDERHMLQLHNAEQACLRARDLTTQLLTFAKGGEPIKQATRIDKLVRDSAVFAVSGSNLRCEFELTAEHCAVNADVGQITQVINNLVINANQAMPDGGILHISVAEAQLDGATLPLPAGAYIRIAIRDEGTGILPEHLDRIFDPYFTTKTNGSGLGLASCYSIIRNHGGHIGVESTPGVGSTFTIHLPLCSDSSDKLDDEPEDAVPGGQERILVMDDEPGVRSFSRMVLEELGYRVDVASDVIEAVSIYSAALDEGEPFAGVILDLTIRGGPGGKEAMQQLLAIDPKVRGIVCSGYSADAIMANYRDYGFAGVVVKPYEVADLAKTLRAVLDGEQGCKLRATGGI